MALLGWLLTLCQGRSQSSRGRIGNDCSQRSLSKRSHTKTNLPSLRSDKHTGSVHKQSCVFSAATLGLLHCLCHSHIKRSNYTLFFPLTLNNHELSDFSSMRFFFFLKDRSSSPSPTVSPFMTAFLGYFQETCFPLASRGIFYHRIITLQTSHVSIRPLSVLYLTVVCVIMIRAAQDWLLSLVLNVQEHHFSSTRSRADEAHATGVRGATSPEE